MTAPPELVITGRIATLGGDAGFGWVQGISITAGRVTLAGEAADALRTAGRQTRVWRLADELCVMPGITDAHLHLGMSARAATALDLDDAPDRATILGRIGAADRAEVSSGSPAGWPIGRGELLIAANAASRRSR